MSDVDIDLTNAQKALLARNQPVTVQALSQEVKGIYEDDLIAGWLEVNADNDGVSHEAWLEHRLVVGAISPDARLALGSVDCSIETISGASSGTVLQLIRFLYDEPEDDDRGFTLVEVRPLSAPSYGPYLEIEVTCPDTPFNCELIVHSTRGNKAQSVIQESVTDLQMITQREWFTLLDREWENISGH